MASTAAPLFALIVWACDGPLIAKPQQCGQTVVRDLDGPEACQEAIALADYVVEPPMQVVLTRCEPQAGLRATTGPLALFPPKQTPARKEMKP